MKVFLIKQEDLDMLLAMIDRDPKHGQRGGSSLVLTEHDRQVYDEAHRFYNYQVRTWIEDVSK